MPACPRGSQANGAALAHKVGVKGIHIAERDTQRAAKPKPMGTFVNTWSVEGFVSEGLQPAELGWGTHEKASCRRKGAATSSARIARST